MIALLLALPLFAHASYTVQPQQPPVKHTFFCTADGYDYNGRLRSISGQLKNSELEAQQDALRVCRGFYTNCEVASCFQEQ
jgi:hypothetical protein